MNKNEEKIVVSKDENLQLIEDTRSEFLKKYKVHDALKKVVFAVCFLGIIVCLIVLPTFWQTESPSKTVIQIGIPLICVGIMLAYGIVVKKMIDGKMKNYFKTYYDSVNKYSLNSKSIKNVMLDSTGKVTKEEFSENQIYKDIFEVGSRGLTTFEYNKIPMSIIECAAQVKGDKRVKPVFVGKYIVAPTKYESKEPTILYLKGTGLILPPTNIEDKKVVLDNKKMIVYSNVKNWDKTLTPKIIKMIESIKTNDLLVDLTICLLNKKIYVCMGYNDPLMIPPLEKQFDPKPNEQFKKELAQVLPIVEALK